MPNARKITILLVDDHQLVRESCREILATEPDMAVIGEAADGLAAVELAQELQPDLVIMDVTMPNMGGIEATRLIREALRHTTVLALSMHTNPGMICAILRAGAAGYVSKTCRSSELPDAIRKVAAGGTYLHPSIALAVAAEQKSRGEHGSLLEKLSDREQDVLRLLADGDSAEVIASKLDISEKTVFSHRKNVTRKLGISSIAELTKFAIREGLVTI